MKKKILICISLFLSLLFIFTPKVEAKTSLKSIEKYYEQNQIGSITLYDDYTVTITYSIQVEDIVFSVCPQGDCTSVTTQTHDVNQSYHGEEKSVEFNLVDYFDFENQTTYIISVEAKFLPETTSINGYPADMEHVVEYIQENASENPGDDNKYEEGIKDSTGKIEDIFRDIIIPILYGAIIVVMVIKGVLLALDLAKYSDQPDIRKEKIRAFAYFGVAMFAVALLNTFAGWYTGLFG